MYYNSNKKLTKIIPIIALAMTKEELEKEEDIMFGNVLCNLDKINDSNIVPVLMPIEEENKWHEEMMLEYAKREGVEEKSFDVVHNMLKKQFDFKTISEITRLPIKKIKEIAKKIN